VTADADAAAPGPVAAAPDPGFPMPLERGKIREFAIATGSDSPAYLDDPAPPIPLTFLRTSAFWRTPDAASPLAGAGVQLDLRRILHGEQEYEFPAGPPRAGTELTVRSSLESITEKEGKRGGTMTLIVTVEEFTDAGGTVVARSRSTLIQTGKAPS
jgi:hypothetical protein